MNPKTWIFWIDTGGTFTDCLAFDPKGSLRRIKVLSSGALRGKIIRKLGPCLYEIHHSWPNSNDIFKDYQFKLTGSEKELHHVRSINFDTNQLEIKTDLKNEIVANCEFEISSGEEAPVLCIRLATNTGLKEKLPHLEIRLGSTKGTNALLERKGTKVCFVVSKGFGDLIEIGTQQRPDIFALEVIKRKPLYAQVVEINGRIDSNGRILEDLSDVNIEDLCNSVSDSKMKAVAVALINSHKSDLHERKVEYALHKTGMSYVSLSSEMAREIKVLQRANTAIVNAYLSPIIQEYANAVISKVPDGSLKIMTSAGGLVDASMFQPKDSLLSGPAGGVVGAAFIARQMNQKSILALDMGGTSTDVSRYDGKFDYSFETEIDGIPVFSPSMNIETVAAGGGSICNFEGYKLKIGPESAGASPGPACYGAGGPLAITDINLLIGRIDAENFGIPLDTDAAESALKELQSQMRELIEKERLLEGFLQIANEKMAEAIKRISLSKGYDPSEYALLAFGGAGGQHACAVADLLDMKQIIVPFDAGLLSALGMGVAEIERFSSQQLLMPYQDCKEDLSGFFKQLAKNAEQKLVNEGIHRRSIYIRRRDVFIRFKGQETTIEISYGERKDLIGAFREKYENLYGHWLEHNIIEIESLKLVAAAHNDTALPSGTEGSSYTPQPLKTIDSFTANRWKNIPAYTWESLKAGAQVSGPALLMSKNSTVFIDVSWELNLKKDLNAILTKKKSTEIRYTSSETTFDQSAGLELFSNRFKSVADEMGAVLQRSSFSVNIKERLDFSCALLDTNGYLVANAPHIPVHLGGLGICVRSVLNSLSMEAGDIVITNHPGYGGSHLPDITLISAVYDDDEDLLGYVANRAHHAELGGITPGSVPANAKNLSEEGVVIKPMYLAKSGNVDWTSLIDILSSSKYPSRSIDENLADLNGALASIKTGVRSLVALCYKYGREQVYSYMESLQHHSALALEEAFYKKTGQIWRATEYLDDGHKINVSIIKQNGRIYFDFTGSSGIHPGNLNATYAILNSAIIYVLKLMIPAPIPLNEGIMRNVELTVPTGFLDPDFEDDPTKCPAVVGGNTETSQRIVDTLIKAFGLAACSQGTMNNLIFGNDHFGFYETIGGGVGAGDGFNGASAVHQHMTNTRITDPEIMEHRYPVQVDRMAVRKGSGGEGKYKGGDGIIREITFKESVDLNILSQHRKEAPGGIEGGKAGMTGKQRVIRKDSTVEVLRGVDGTKLAPGDRIIIETPGGGGWGKPIS